MVTFKGQLSGINIIPSGGGVFEVKVGDDLVFSKKALERFPQEDEIAGILEEKHQLKRVAE